MVLWTDLTTRKASVGEIALRVGQNGARENTKPQIIGSRYRWHDQASGGRFALACGCYDSTGRLNNLQTRVHEEITELSDEVDVEVQDKGSLCIAVGRHGDVKYE